MKKFKKQITLVSFNRFFNPTSYLFCSSNILQKNQIFISNYAFKSLYIHTFPKKFLNSLIQSSKLLDFTNNFLGITKFKNKQNMLSHYMTLENSNKLKIGFIKCQNLYLVGNNSSIKYLDVYFIVSELNFILLNYIYKFYNIIDKINKKYLV